MAICGVALVVPSCGVQSYASVGPPRAPCSSSKFESPVRKKPMDIALKKIQEKVQAGERISDQEALTLYASNDLIGLGEIANIVRERKSGQKTFFNINRHLNYSNVCYVECKFCEFGQPKKSAKAYELSLEEMKRTAAKAQEDGATELHIVGGLHPDFKIDYYTTI